MYNLIQSYVWLSVGFSIALLGLSVYWYSRMKKTEEVNYPAPKPRHTDAALASKKPNSPLLIRLPKLGV